MGVHHHGPISHVHAFPPHLPPRKGRRRGRGDFCRTPQAMPLQFNCQRNSYFSLPERERKDELIAALLVPRRRVRPAVNWRARSTRAVEFAVEVLVLGGAPGWAVLSPRRKRSTCARVYARVPRGENPEHVSADGAPPDDLLGGGDFPAVIYSFFIILTKR